MRERAPGHWELRAFLGRDPISGKPRQATRTFVGSDRAATKELSKLVAEVEAGKFDRSTATLGQLLDKWIEFVETTQRPRTVYENRRKIETRIRPELGLVRLSKLSPQTLDTAYGRWLDDGLSAATVYKYHSIISAACRQAMRWGWITSSPTDRVTPPSSAITRAVPRSNSAPGPRTRSADVRPLERTL